MSSVLEGAKAPRISIFSQRVNYEAGSVELISEAVFRSRGSALRAHERMVVTRHERISKAAYLLAEARGFESGHDAADWFRAQADIDAQDAGIALI